MPNLVEVLDFAMLGVAVSTLAISITRFKKRKAKKQSELDRKQRNDLR